jgi:5-methylcytosine-specific restriction enzyme subunit McrC
VPVGVEECPDLPNLFAKLLIDSTRRLVRRGLDRGYLQRVEETKTPHGKLLITQMLKEQTRRRGSAICGYDELEHDVLHNQILKATARALVYVDTLTAEMRHELRLITKQLANVSDIRLTANLFRRVQLSRDRYLYGILMRLCEFVFDCSLPDQHGDRTTRFADVLADEVRMSSVFEDFLRNFYSHELREYSVKRPIFNWDSKELTPGAMSLMPEMRTDIVLTSANRTIVIDAKHYRDILSGKPGYPKKIRSGHLYQLFSYVKHAEIANPGKCIDGALIYPANGSEIYVDYNWASHCLRVIYVDLAAPWQQIHERLLSLPRKPFATGLITTTQPSIAKFDQLDLPELN